MSRTIIGVGDVSAVKRFSAMLFVDQAREGYWSSKFMSKGRDAMVPCQILTELENDAGDTITYDLFAQLRQKPKYGDDRLKGSEAPLQKYNDSVSIDQVRTGVSGGGRMTRKRTLHDLRLVTRKLQGDWWGRWTDEVTQMYASGARGINADFIEDTAYTGFAGNAFATPDANHQVYGGTSTAKANVTTSDGVNLTLIDRLVAIARTLGGGTTGIPKIRPMRIDGNDRYVFLMHPFDEEALRINTSTGQWIDIQKAAAAAQGQGNPIFQGGMGMYNNVIMHSHQIVVRFNDYGVGVNLPASRCIFMGAQALVQAFGSPGNGLRFDWHEETDDRGNELIIDTSAIMGIKKTRFNGNDYGVISADVYSRVVT